MFHSLRNISILAFAQAMMNSSNGLQVTAAGLIGLALSADNSLATLPLALQFISGMITTPFASLLMGKIGRRAGFMLGTAIGVTGAITAYYAITQNSFELFCMGTSLLGAFTGFGNYYRFAAVDSVHISFRSRAISWVMAGGVVAAFIGPNLAAATQHSITAHPFAASYLAIAVIHLFTMMLLIGLDIPKVDQHQHHGGRPLREIALQPSYLTALIAGALGFGIMALVMTATPLSMNHHHHSFPNTSFVIQWHVFAMFAPSFFTGHLIRRFGLIPLMVVGVIFDLGCVALNLLGTSLWHYWSALFMLGIGWNFLFVGATTMLTETYQPYESAKSLALNDFIVFTTVSLASLTAGGLQHNFGWQAVNIGVLPAVLIILLTLLWCQRLSSTTIKGDYSTSAEGHK
ncbi:MAG: MFS transporter [Candidatus Sedimenticola sp. (ex Thyasira tokunagai)]